jgi:predicted secreted protein
MEPVVVEGQAGAAIVLPLPRAPATGHEWRLILPAGVQQIADSVPPAGHHQPGDAAGGQPQVRAPAGQYRITAQLARPWTPDQPVKTVEIDLRVR